MLSSFETSDKPFFSLIIPVYNAENFIGRCLDSLLSQTFKDYEIIAVDDCSKDNSLKVLKEYGKENPVIRVISQEKNSGSVATREVGMINSRGVYIIHVDADDYYLSDKRLEHIADEIKKTDADIILTGYTTGSDSCSSHIVQNKLHIGFYDEIEYNKLKSDIFGFCKSGTDRLVSTNLWSKAVKRELYLVSIGKTSRTLKIGEDSALTLPALALARSISIIDEPSYFYFIHKSQMTKGYYKNYFNEALNNLLTIKQTIFENTKSTVFDFAITENICHISAYSVMNEIRNPNKELSKQTIAYIVNNPVVIDSINSDARKRVNCFFKLVIHFIKTKNYSMLVLLGKIYCFFMQ